MVDGAVYCPAEIFPKSVKELKLSVLGEIPPFFGGMLVLDATEPIAAAAVARVVVIAIGNTTAAAEVEERAAT